MSKFLSKLRQVLDNPHANDGAGDWRLISPLKFKSDLMRQDFVVCAGFVTDHASVPRGPLIYAEFGNRYHRSAVVHDYLCRTKAVPRDIADQVFLEAMRTENAEALEGLVGEELEARKAALEGRAQLMYAAVRSYSVVQDMWG